MPRTLRRAGAGKRHPLNMRTTATIREQLEAAANVNGRSLAQEVEARLERSFHQEHVFGSREMASLAFEMAAIFAVDTHGEDWTTDPIVYARGVRGVVAALLRKIPAWQDKERVLHSIVNHHLSLRETERLRENERLTHEQNQKPEQAA